ncbi:MAG: hypothetical protein ACLUMK_14010 [Christensenellales bacterium]
MARLPRFCWARAEAAHSLFWRRCERALTKPQSEQHGNVERSAICFSEFSGFIDEQARPGDAQILGEVNDGLFTRSQIGLDSRIRAGHPQKQSSILELGGFISAKTVAMGHLIARR